VNGGVIFLTTPFRAWVLAKQKVSPLLFLRRGAGVRSFPELITMPSPKYFYLNFITPPFRGCVKINNETGTKKRERGLNL